MERTAVLSSSPWIFLTRLGAIHSALSLFQKAYIPLSVSKRSQPLPGTKDSREHPEGGYPYRDFMFTATSLMVFQKVVIPLKNGIQSCSKHLKKPGFRLGGRNDGEEAFSTFYEAIFIGSRKPVLREGSKHSGSAGNETTRNHGMMEWWNSGARDLKNGRMWTTAVFGFPIFHYSIIPLCLYSNPPSRPVCPPR
jgi:hypothetical protein